MGTDSGAEEGSEAYLPDAAPVKGVEEYGAVWGSPLFLGVWNVKPQ